MSIRYFAIACVFILAGCAEQDNSIAIQNVTVIDAVNGVRENQTVVFDGDEIIAVQASGQPVTAAEIIDGTGKYLIPGLWDFHVHLTYDSRLTDAMPELFLSWGITSVRDTGALLQNILPVVERMRAEDAIAPRVYFAGPLLDGQFVVYNGDGRPEIGVSVPDPQAARDIVRRFHDAGVDFIKVYEMVTPEVFHALVETARELELPIDSHVPLSMRASVAGPRVDSIEHLRNIEMDCTAAPVEFLLERRQRLQNPDNLPGAALRGSLHSLQRIPSVDAYDQERCDETIAALADTMMVPTLRLNSFSAAPSYLNDDWDDAISRLPTDVADDFRQQGEQRAQTPTSPTQFAEWSLFLTGHMHAAGVPVGAGTDTPITLSIPGYSLHEELDMLVRAGLSPMDAIASATIKPAEYFSLQDRMGSIDVGKVADLVLLDANPLEDIGNSKRINLVVSKGSVVSP